MYEEVFTFSEDRPLSKFASSYKPFQYKTNENSCWLCVSHKVDVTGYVRIRRNKKDVSLHRYIYEQLVGSIPDGMIIMHSCDNRTCFNPDHLSIGTHKENQRDKALRGRSAKGSKNGRAKLTEDQVREIRKDFRTLKDIAKDYGVSNAMIGEIKNLKNWKHII
ncbi:HNH endonuclease [Metabacillus idriensis]|nr:HNH endonuclease [Metabacillus idriensis]